MLKRKNKNVLIISGILVIITLLLTLTNFNEIKIDFQCKVLSRDLNREFKHDMEHISVGYDSYNNHMGVYVERKEKKTILKVLYNVKQYVEKYLQENPDYFTNQKNSYISVQSDLSDFPGYPNPWFCFENDYSGDTKTADRKPLLNMVIQEELSPEGFNGIEFDTTLLDIRVNFDFSILKSFPYLETLNLEKKRLTEEQFSKIKGYLPSDCEIINYELIDHNRNTIYQSWESADST